MDKIVKVLLFLALSSCSFGQILAPILAGAPSGGGGNTTTFVQQSSAADNDCGGAFSGATTCSFGSTLTSGNKAVCAISIHTTTNDTVTSITGAGIGSWAKVVGTSSASTDCEVWRGTVGGSPGTTITVNESTVGNFSTAIKCGEFASLTGTVDGSPPTPATGTSTSPATAAYSTSNANDLIVAAMCDEGTNNPPSANPSGYTNLTWRSNNVGFGGSDGVQFSYKIISSSGAQSATWTILSADWVAALVGLQN